MINYLKINIKLKLFILLCTSSFLTWGQYPPGYYDGTEGLTGEELKTALYNIIKDHQVQSYSSIWTHFYSTDDKGNGIVWDMYSDVPGGTPAYTYNLGSDQCGNYSSEGDCYNREHSFPKSWFNDAPPMNTDIFHIYPTDGYVNGRRSNYAYGEVDDAQWTSTNGSKTGSCSFPGYTGTVFEPIDAYKGDFARTYFYMMTRYMNVVSSWNSPMLEGSDLSEWAAALLISWHEMDPADQKENDRNNAIYQIQDNRNPFIDEPTWVADIWGPFASTIYIEEPDARIWYGQNQLFIKGEKTLSGKLIVYTIVGQEVASFNLSANESSFDLNLKPGIYVAVVVSNYRIKSYKFSIL